MADLRGEKRKLVPQKTASPTRRRISDMTANGNGSTEKQQEEPDGKREKKWETLRKKRKILKRWTDVKFRQPAFVFPLFRSAFEENGNYREKKRGLM